MLSLRPYTGETAAFLNQIQTAHTYTCCSLSIVLEHNWGNNRPPIIGPFVKIGFGEKIMFFFTRCSESSCHFTRHKIDCTWKGWMKKGRGKMNSFDVSAST